MEARKHNCGCGCSCQGNQDQEQDNNRGNGIQHELRISALERKTASLEESALSCAARKCVTHMRDEPEAAPDNLAEGGIVIVDSD